MNTCISSHTKCSQFQQLSTESSERPSRILQINGDQLKLRCDVLQLENCSYLTLSHMWGSEPTKQLVLTEANLASYQDGIALETLPAIFRKAVSLTQLLGHEYLWIDSLCIIQDSLTDWEAEASKMASTYGNSLCNLTCIVPPDRFHQEQQHDPRFIYPVWCDPQQLKVQDCMLCQNTYTLDRTRQDLLVTGIGPWTGHCSLEPGMLYILRQK
jgi:hypothetical protein